MNTTKYQTLHEGFFENSKNNPDSIAVVFEEKKISYKDYAETVRNIAGKLLEMGVKRNDKVAVILERGERQLATYIAVMSVGATYIPISIHQPEGRKKQILTDSKADYVIDSLEAVEGVSKMAISDDDIVCCADDSAYVIYTSGSTGMPKGVEMTHKAAMNTINEVTELFDIKNTDKVLNVSSSDFDLSIFDFYALLSVGGTVVLIKDDDYRNPLAWQKAIMDNQVTIWNSAPALMEMLSAVTGEKEELASLRLSLLSGDWIPMGLYGKWKCFSGKDSLFVSLGGATEAGIWSNYYVVDGIKDDWVSIPYGKALPNQEFCIVNEGKVISEPNISGELWIGGHSLAKGYINDEKKTADKFVYDDKNKRWYRTGDLGQYFPDGNIEFLGRMDNQIKLRGHRIELGEIENKAVLIEGVENVTVIAVGDRFRKEIILFYTGKEYSAEAINELLADGLPQYSIPHDYVHVDKMPLNENGKIDRRALEDKYLLTIQKEESVLEDENIVIREWEKLTGRKIESADEDVFGLGADSLTIAKFIERMRTEYDVAISFNTVFENPKIKDLANIVDELIKGTDGEEGEI